MSEILEQAGMLPAVLLLVIILLGGGAKVEFKATESISLEAGFEVVSGAEFFAQVKPQTEDCGDWNTIFHKTGNTEVFENAFSTTTNTNEDKTTFYNVKFFPNPFQDVVNFEFYLEEDEPIVINVYNTLGQIVFRRKLEGKEGSNTSTISVSSQDKILIVEMIARNSSFRKVLLKE